MKIAKWINFAPNYAPKIRKLARLLMKVARIHVETTNASALRREMRLWIRSQITSMRKYHATLINANTPPAITREGLAARTKIAANPKTSAGGPAI